jgi:hypothetical protein
LIFETEDSVLWQLSDAGLGWTYFTEAAATWTVETDIQQHLPATVNPRPPSSALWTYDFELTIHYVRLTEVGTLQTPVSVFEKWLRLLVS